MGSITINGKNVKQWVIGGKTVQSLTMGGKVLSFREPNSFVGTWSTPAQEAAFMAITDTVANQQFLFETGITSITLPEVITIGADAFTDSGFSSVHIPKATTIGNTAFDGMSNNLEIWLNKKFNTDAEKTRIFGAGWSTITFHWLNDDGTALANSFTGTFSTPAQQTKFMGITNLIKSSDFSGEDRLTGITLPFTKEIEYGAFETSPLTHIDLRNVNLIGDNSFDEYGPFLATVNSATTQVWLPDSPDKNGVRFESEKYLNYMFGTGNWDKIHFHFVNPTTGAIRDWVKPTGNSYTGTFSSPGQQAKFMGITTIVHSSDFSGEDKLTGITFPLVKEIEYGAFETAPLTHIDLRNVNLIGDNSFDEYGPFLATVNAATTNVWLPAGADKNGVKFNSDKYLNYMFGAGNWNHITFHWV